MESDDDYQLFSAPEELSPPVQHRKLKRLKKAVRASNDPSFQSGEEGPSVPPVNSSQSQSLESSETLGFEDSNEPLRSQSPSEGFDDETELNSDSNGLGFEEDREEPRRALDFDDMADEFDGNRFDRSEGMEEKIADLKMEKSEKKRLNEEGSDEKKEKKKKKRDRSVGDNAKPKTSSSNKRREEKERKDHLQQLHAESQRLLRETRDAAFKPIPIVHKPISSILEKIRQRKLEVSKKTVIVNNNCFTAENNGSRREDEMDFDLENISIEEKGVLAKPGEEEIVACHVDEESSLEASHMDVSKESATHSDQENVPSQMGLNEESTNAFRAPVDDTQDLFCDSQTSDSKEELPSDQQNSPLEEVLEPSLLAMNLKFDSAPPDDVSSDEEDNDKENIDPHPHRTDNGCSSPRGDPVKAFVDEEAVEEDDSDNDLFRFQENEDDEDDEDFEELNDMIATEYKEKPSDKERRNELHQKWLEQQDAAGTDNLLQRLNCGPKHRDTTLLEEENEEDDGDEEEFGDEAAEDPVPRNVVRINSRKAKQMISQMFSDKDDAYLSSDDEETEKRLVKQRLLNRTEEKATFLSPAEDDSSREVFGLIKKLNIVPDPKKKAKTASFFDTLLAGGNSNSSSKSSFLGRASSHSLPSSHKQGTSMVRSFIFGRDDSNSRNSISKSEDSSDTIPRENGSTRNVTTKFSYSQSKSSTQSTKIAAETVSGPSLFEILKRSSRQSNICKQDNMVGLTQTVLATFKIPKKPVKIERRT
uniref:Putative glutamic acid-rich protein n=1 Tax=Davidia involucrata TaxID=16924 RepID=A0A5B7BN11_DAVIN